ncbi:MAG: hypothetical protein WA945_08590 [Arcobacteraceae bacterium]
MKFVILLIILSSFVFSKECYFNKVKDICYYKYFDRSKIHNAKLDELYYVNENGSIYTFDNILEVKFKSIGAIFTILNDYELEFVDKINKETYLFKVEHRRGLFPAISKINKLKTVMTARPHKERRYTKSFILAKQEAKKARLKAVMEKAQNKARNSESKYGIRNNSTQSGSTEKRSFLKGEVN